MTLIPLTMCRFSISALSGSIVDRFIPFNKTMQMHAYLGYVMVSLVVFALVAFIALYSSLCLFEGQEYCEKLSSGIMWSGYVIAGLAILVGVTSFLRHRLPYEVFYAIHHVVFLLYILTILHTFDSAHRNGEKQRSQTYPWVTATFLFYLVDRSANFLNNYYQVKRVAALAISGAQGGRMVLLTIRRPTLFEFKPGQYAFLRVGSIDYTWHPFSIASGPTSPNLEFYIEVFDDNSWTGKLWGMANDTGGNDLRVDMDVMGPYGTSLVRNEDFSHAIVFGTGTGMFTSKVCNINRDNIVLISYILLLGIVPMISLFHQHIQSIVRLEPQKMQKEIDDQQERMIRMEFAEYQDKGSIAQKIYERCHGKKPSADEPSGPLRRTQSFHRSQSFRDNLEALRSLNLDAEVVGCEITNLTEQKRRCKAMQEAALAETRSIYGVVALALMTVLGVTAIALTISWNTYSFEPAEREIVFAQILTIVFQCCFIAVAVFIWDAHKLTALIDFVFCILAPLVDWFWHTQYESMGRLTGINVVRYCLFTGYMVGRFWAMTVRPRHRSWKRAIFADGSSTFQRLDLVWVSRSSALVSQILPLIDRSWSNLDEYWEDTSICRISVFVTDKDQEANDRLREEIEHSGLYQNGAIHFCRPNFDQIIENHTLDLIGTRRSSSSVLAFCGSPVLSQKLHQQKISNDMLTAITGNKKHQMVFVSESYGGTKSTPKRNDQVDDKSRHQSSTRTSRPAEPPHSASMESVEEEIEA